MVKAEEKKNEQPTKPWKPTSLFDLVPKRNGYTRRLVRAEDVDRRMSDGWELVRVNSNTANLAPLTLLDGTQISGVLRMRGMVVMEIPDAKAQQIRDYYSSLTKGSLRKEVSELDNNTSIPNVNSGAYGEIKTKAGDIKIKEE